MSKKDPETDSCYESWFFDCILRRENHLSPPGAPQSTTETAAVPGQTIWHDGPKQCMSLVHQRRDKLWREPHWHLADSKDMTI